MAVMESSTYLLKLRTKHVLRFYNTFSQNFLRFTGYNRCTHFVTVKRLVTLTSILNLYLYRLESYYRLQLNSYYIVFCVYWMSFTNNLADEQWIDSYTISYIIYSFLGFQPKLPSIEIYISIENRLQIY